MPNARTATATRIFKQAQRFERSIRSFLEAVGFSDVTGGPAFKLGNSSQIDACGGAGEVLLVVDAHTTVEQRRTSIRNKIKALRGERTLLLRGMHRHRTYKKYRELRLVVATRGFPITQSDRAFARNHPRVYLWDDQFLDYYTKLARLTGTFAKNDLLGELDVKVSSTIPQDSLVVPALRTKLRGRTAYLFFARPEALLAISYVARREKGKEQHYQRLIDKSRLGPIGAFLNDRRKKGFFANNVILNFQTRPTFKSIPGSGQPRGLRVGLLRLPRSFRAAWIIDGQHRLFGFTRAAKQAHDLPLPVIGFQRLNQTKQAELFLEINRNQKAVPPDLIWDLEGEINPNTEYGVISNAVKLLNRGRPFSGTISIPFEGRAKRKHVKLGNICDGILDRGLAAKHTETMKARAKNPLYAGSGPRRTEKLLAALRVYFSLCASVLRSDWSKKRDGFFYTNNGINVLLRVYEACLAHYKHKPSKAELTRILRVIKKWLREAYGTTERIEDLRRITSSEGGRAEIASRILEFVEDRLSLTGLGGPRDRSTDLASQSGQLERQVAKFITSEMETRFGTNWLRTRTPADLSRRVQDRRGRPARPIDQVLTLGECLNVVMREDNWREVFEAVFGKTFRSKDGFRVKFEELIEIRNTAVHRRAELTQHDHRTFELYAEDLRTCMRSRRASRPVRGTPTTPESSPTAQPAAATA